ncbi:MAG: DUF4435 domain-containing protein [Xanthomonadales bacterium]|nr:DUF4435 domain-containing protein [Xanthomonadales bacterium]
MYVEDVNDEAFYRSLLDFATGKKIKIARVFALGNKSEVIRVARAHDHRARRALFIIDGDLEWVRGDPVPAVVGLHRHAAYCVENLLLCEKAVVALLSQEIAVTEAEAATRFGYKSWQDSITMPLCELFSAFATSQVFVPSFATVSRGVGVMCSERLAPRRSELDQNKVATMRQAALREAESASSKADVVAELRRVTVRVNSLPDPLAAVSGKDFLLPLLCFKLQSLGCRIKRASLRIRLACAGEASRFSSLAEALESAARGHQ